MKLLSFSILGLATICYSLPRRSKPNMEAEFGAAMGQAFGNILEQQMNMMNSMNSMDSNEIDFSKVQKIIVLPT